MTERTTYTFTLDPPRQTLLKELLARGNYRPRRVEHTIAAAETDSCSIALYKNGKCVIQGRGASDFVLYVLEPLVMQAAGLGYEDVLDPASVHPHMGVDESGKGDYFGPLVVAAAYIDPSLAQRMRAMNVRDSKTISSDSKALDMGRDLRGLLGNRFSLVRIGPRTYNRLYARMRNVNTLLAWAHARAIENLLEKLPDCPRAVSDQFGSKRQVENALMRRGRAIDLVQRPRAESDLAVAAASVLAREEFLRSLKELSDRHGVPLPKGASPSVREAAVQLATLHAPAILLETSKCHFKTTDEVLAALRVDRTALGPDGKAVSRPYVRRERRPEDSPPQPSVSSDAHGRPAPSTP